MADGDVGELFCIASKAPRWSSSGACLPGAWPGAAGARKRSCWRRVLLWVMLKLLLLLKQQLSKHFSDGMADPSLAKGRRASLGAASRSCSSLRKQEGMALAQALQMVPEEPAGLKGLLLEESIPAMWRSTAATGRAKSWREPERLLQLAALLEQSCAQQAGRPRG